jgi:hypothetical protein
LLQSQAFESKKEVEVKKAAGFQLSDDDDEERDKYGDDEGAEKVEGRELS